MLLSSKQNTISAKDLTILKVKNPFGFRDLISFQDFSCLSFIVIFKKYHVDRICQAENTYQSNTTNNCEKYKS